jgi:hypothetical protein
MICYWRANKPKLADLAIRFKVQQALATRLIKQYKKDPGFLARLNLKCEARAEKTNLVATTVQEMISRRKDIWTLA